MFYYILFFFLFNFYYFDRIVLEVENITQYYNESILDIKKMKDSLFFVSTESRLYISSIFTGHTNSYQEIPSNNYTDIYYISSLDLFLYTCTPNFFLALVKNDEIIYSINEYKYNNLEFNIKSKCKIVYIEKEKTIFLFFAYQNPSNMSIIDYGYLNVLIENDTETNSYKLTINYNYILSEKFIILNDNIYKNPIIIASNNIDDSIICLNLFFNEITDEQNFQNSRTYLILGENFNKKGVIGDIYNENEYMTQLIANDTGFFLAGFNFKSNYIKYIGIHNNEGNFNKYQGKISVSLGENEMEDIKYSLYLSKINSTNIALLFCLYENLYLILIKDRDDSSLHQMNLPIWTQGIFMIQFINNIFSFFFLGEKNRKYYIFMQPISCKDDNSYIHENETISKNVLNLTTSEIFTSNIKLVTSNLYFNLSKDENNNYIITYHDFNQSVFPLDFFLYTNSYEENYNYYLNYCKYKIYICNHACQTCSNYSDSNESPHCLTCEENYYTKIDEIDNSNCFHYKHLIEFYYFNSTLKLFDKCNKACLYCSNNSNDDNNTLCINEMCNENYAYLSDNSKQCYLNNLTIQNYYINSDNSSFDLCNSACLYCSEGSNDINETKCIAKQCNDKYTYLIDNENNCILTTRIIEKYYYNNITNIFEKCNDACLTCSNYSSNIYDTKCFNKSCNNGYAYLINNETVCFLITSQIEGYYYDNEENIFKLNIENNEEEEIENNEDEEDKKEDENKEEENKNIKKEHDIFEKVEDYIEDIKNNLFLYYNEDDITNVNGSYFNIKIYDTTKNITKNNNESYIYLGDCEEKLRKYYNLSDTDKIIVIKIDTKTDDTKLTDNLDFFLLNSSGVKLDSSICEEIKIEIPIKTNTTSDINLTNIEKFIGNGIDITDINDSFFNNLCIPFDFDESNGMPFNERTSLYINVSLCMDGCSFYDMNNVTIYCYCNSTSREKEQEKGTKHFVKSIYNNNFFTIRCYKLVFDNKRIRKNLGFWLYFCFFIFQLINLIYFILKYWINPIINYLLQILKTLKNPPIKRSKKNLEDKSTNLGNKSEFTEDQKNNKKFTEKILSSEQLLNNNEISLENNKNINNNNLSIYSNNSKKEILNNQNFNFESSKQRKFLISDFLKDNYNDNNIVIYEQKNIVFNEKKNPKKLILSEDQIERLVYKHALTYDERNFWQMYKYSILRKHSVFFAFCFNSIEKLMNIKITILITTIIFNWGFNALYFTQNQQHKYFNNETVNFLSRFPKIILSCISSIVLLTIIDIIFSYDGLLHKTILETDKNKFSDLILKDIRTIKIKMIVGYIVTFLLSAFFWYYCASFCAVYPKYQYRWFRDSIQSYLISLTFPFFLTLVYIIFRYSGINCKNKVCYYIGIIINYFLQVRYKRLKKPE